MTDQLNLERIPGKLGAKPTIVRPELYLHNFAKFGAAEPPPLPSVWDQTQGITTQIGMLGNDVYGDCVVAATEHGRMFKALTGMKRNAPIWEKGFRPPKTAYTESLYFQYGRYMGEPGSHPDEGCEVGSWAQWGYHLGLWEAYAQIDWSNPATRWQNIMQGAIDFDGVLITVNCTPQMQVQFQENTPFTVGPGNEPNPGEGHGIWFCGFNQSLGIDKYATWGNIALADRQWSDACITGAFVFLTKEDADRAGYNIQAAITEIEALPGADRALAA